MNYPLSAPKPFYLAPIGSSYPVVADKSAAGPVNPSPACRGPSIRTDTRPHISSNTLTTLLSPKPLRPGARGMASTAP